MFLLSSKEIVQEGLFFVYIKPSKEKSVNFRGKEYITEIIIPKITKEEIDAVLSNAANVKFLGITSDQQLYKPNKDAKILISALSYPNRTSKLTFLRNGAIWLEEKVQLSSVGLALYTLKDMDIGKYDVVAEIEGIGIGKTSFDVAVFELEPFQVVVESQSISKEQLMTCFVNVSILHEPYSGTLKVGLFCAFCRQVVLHDEVTCTNGKATVSFNVGGHTAPFSLEFIVPERGYTAMIQLEGTMPQQRIPSPITANLKNNYQMSLFPQTGSYAVQGVNVTTAEVNPEAMFDIDKPVADKVTLKITRPSELVSITIFNPVTQDIKNQEHNAVKVDAKWTIETADSHVIVFFAGLSNGILSEGFFAAFQSPASLVSVEVPSKVEAGGKLSITLRNPTSKGTAESEVFLLVFDKRKTHTSLYKKIGERIHAHLKQGLEQLPSKIQQNLHDRRMLFDEKYRKEQEEIARRLREEQEMKESVKHRSMEFETPKMAKQRGGMAFASKPAPMMKPPSQPPKLDAMPAMPAVVTAPQGPPADTMSPESAAPEMPHELFEEFEDVLYGETFKLEAGESKVVEVSLANQITTWEVRMYSFRGVLFNEIVKDVSAEKSRALTIRAPKILDIENGDSAEIEVHYLTEVPGTLEILLNGSSVIECTDVAKGNGVLTTTIQKKGLVQALLKTANYQLEAIHEVRLPFEQMLLYTHFVHLYPYEPFTPPQEVFVLPNPLPLIRESVHALQGFPFGCAEQTSAKLGALALAYKYHKTVHSGEEVPLIGMIRQGINRLFSLYYNESKMRFGLWNVESADEKTTVQVLRNLAPLYPILDDLTLNHYANLLSEVASSLLKEKVKSFNLGVYSTNFIPKRRVDDPLEAAWALLSADVSDKENWLKIIEEAAMLTEETCVWKSPIAWAGVLQTTAEVLRALAKHDADLSEHMKKLYQKGLHFVMSNMINGRLFSTTDTLALIGLFSELPIVETKIKIEGEIKEISESFRIAKEFTAETNVYVHWVEEKVADPFSDLPAKSTKLKIDVDKTECRVGGELTLTITAPNDMYCPVAAICLPPHIAMMKGGGNIQQQYLPFREEKYLLLELVCVRKGTGHIRVIVHDMYAKEQVVKPIPLEIIIKN